MATREHLTSGPSRLIVRVIAFFVFALVLAEIVLRFILPGLPGAGALPGHPLADPALRPRRRGGQTGLNTYGRFCRRTGQWRVNNAGWNSAFDYSHDKDPSRLRVAILGDSYIEGMFSNVDQRVDTDLYGLLHGNANVYSFGMGGWYLAQYIGAARYVRDNFHPEHLLHLSGRFRRGGQPADGAVPHRASWYQIEPRGRSFALVPPQSLYVRSCGPTRVSANSALIRYLILNAQVRLPGQADGDSRRCSCRQRTAGATRQQPDSRPGRCRRPPTTWSTSCCSTTPGRGSSSSRTGCANGCTRAAHCRPCASTPWCSSATPCGAIPSAGFIDLMPWYLRDWQAHHVRFEAVDGVHWNAHANSVVAAAMLDYLEKQGLAPSPQARADD